MFPSSKKSASQKLIAVFDVEGGSVGAAILLVKKDSSTQVLTSLRSTLPYEDRDTRATASGILMLLSEVGQKVLGDFAVQKKYTDSIDAVYAVIRTPWTSTRTLKIEKKFDTETIVTETLINELAQQALSGHSSEENPIFETTVVRVELNGYPTAKPLTKSAHSLAVSVLVSDCDSQIHAGITETLAKFFPAKTPVLRSGVRTVLSVLQEIRPEYSNYVIIDMSSKGSDVVSVINGTALAHEPVQEGVYSILSRISVKRLPEEVLSTLRMIARGQCADDACEAMELAIGLAEPDMVKLFGESMSTLSSKHRLPNRIFLFTHTDLAPWLTKFFGRIDFAQFTQTTQPFTVEAPLPDSLSKLVHVDENTVVDIGLMTASALVHLDQ